jgi:septal ring factor EnvC (AmiA/AmiB activator)
MRPSIALALLLALTAAPAAIAAAQTQENPDSAIKAEKSHEQEQVESEAAKRKELEDIRRQAQESREAASRLRGQENKVLGQLRRIERDLGLTRRRLKNLEARRQQLDRQLSQTQVTLEQSTSAYNDQRTKLAHRLRALYKMGTARELEFLLSTRSFGQLLARWDYLVRVARQDRMLLEDVEARKEQVQATKQKIESNLTEIQRNTRQTTSQNQKLDELRRERASSVDQIRNQRQAYEAAAAELEKTARSIQQLLADLERKRQAESKQGRTPQPYTGNFARGKGELDWPVQGPLVGHFGPERHPRFGTTTLNNGIDIQAAVGTSVRAVAKGRVDYLSEDYGSFGQIIVINHGDGYYTLYGHLSDILVAQGQEVQSGQTIGRVGETGTSLKGTVLHFEVRKGGQALDPESWLK